MMRKTSIAFIYVLSASPLAIDAGYICYHKFTIIVLVNACLDKIAW